MPRVTWFERLKGDRVDLCLDENPFHLAGGGQPGGRGMLVSPGVQVEVQDCRVRDGREVLTGRIIGGDMALGETVEAQVDLQWRDWVARMHSGEHALSRALERNRPGLRVFKVNIGEREGLVTLDFQGDLTWDLLWVAEEEANRVVGEDLPVTVEELTGYRAAEDPDLKANWERLQLDPPEIIRVVSLGGYDRVACCGVHVERTGQIGGVMVLGFKGSSPRWEVRYTVDPVRTQLMMEWSRMVRRMSREIGCPPEDIERVYWGAFEDAKAKAKLLDRLRDHLCLPFEERVRGGHRFHLLDLRPLGMVPAEMMNSAVRRRVESDPSSLGVGVVPAEQGLRFVACRGAGCPVDLSAWLKRMRPRGLKGGGSPQMVSGVAEECPLDEWIDSMLEGV